MALDALTSANIAGSNITIAERWIKMYRKIHNLFLKKHFVNKDDFNVAIDLLNKRIDLLETRLTATLAQLNMSISRLNTHALTHVHATAGLGPPVPATPALTPGPIASFTGSAPIKTSTINAERLDAVLQATGEPVVPLTGAILGA